MPSRLAIGGPMKKVILCMLILGAVVLPAFCQEGEPRVSVNQAVMFNLVPGFGLGSYLQGDDLGTAVLSVISGAEVVGIVCALATASIDYHWNLPQLHFTNLTIVGLQITLISALSGAAFGIVRPYWYARCHRAKIDQNKVSFRIMPTIEPCSDHRGIDACIRYKLQVRYQIESPRALRSACLLSGSGRRGVRGGCICR